MKKGDYIPIKDNAKYTGQDMVWTEECTYKGRTSKSCVGFHYSDKKITAFAPKTTCFFEEHGFIEGHVYKITIAPNTYIERYDDELRVDINKNSKIQYIGRVSMKREYTGRGMIGSPFVTVYDRTLGGKGKVELGR